MPVDAIKRVRLIDIAEKAGVSRVTVCKVLNNSSGNNTRVSEETAKRVRKLAKQLNYRTNMSARSLKTNKTHLIGLIGTGIWGSSTTKFVNLLSIELSELSKYEVSLQVHGIGNDDREAAIWAAYSRPVDGLIVVPDQPIEHGTILSDMIESKFPILFVLNKPMTGCDFVTVDRFKAVEKSIYYLSDLGHKRIGLAIFHESIRKHEAYRTVMKRLGLEIRKDWCHDLHGNYEDGYQLGRVIETGTGHPTAYIMHDDVTAVGFIRALNERGIKVPDEISIIGFGGQEIGDYTTPSLTSIVIPMAEICKKAAEYIFERAYSKTPNRLLGTFRLEIEPELIIRESCGSCLF